MQKLPLKFFTTLEGRQPVRDWLLGLPEQERKVIGNDIRTLQYGWPLGMPLVRKLEDGLWEVRVSFPTRIARVIFTLFTDNSNIQTAVLLHGFIKQSQKTPLTDLQTARQRKALI